MLTPSEPLLGTVDMSRGPVGAGGAVLGASQGTRRRRLERHCWRRSTGAWSSNLQESSHMGPYDSYDS